MKRKLFSVGMFGMVLAFGLVVMGCPIDAPTPAQYTVTYDGNGNTSGDVPESQSCTAGRQATVAGNTGSLVKTGKVFDGWNSNAVGTGTWYCAGGRITVTSDTTLYAVWVNQDEKNFWAMTLTNNTWYSVTAKKIGNSAHCEVWADLSLSDFSTIVSSGQDVANKYESAIYSQITGAFGGIEDVDHNGKVIFLMLDIIDGSVGGGYVGGYFQGYQMYSRTMAPYSNEADMLYMDTKPGFDLVNRQNFYSTMAHELQHLIEFSQTVAKGKPEKDLWINEGLSTGAEYIYGNGNGSPAQQQDRIDYFNSGGRNSSIAKGNNFFVWNGYWDNDVLADYATAYLFFQWLRIHANGIGIYKDIIASPYADYRAVTTQAFSRISSLSTSGNLATDWGTLLGNWLLANAIKSQTGLLGYKGEINTTARPFPVSSTGYPLSPGEGVYSPITGGSVSTTGFSSGSHIKYVGIGAGGSLDTTNPYTGDYLLTFNANSNKGGNDENGKLAASVVSGPQASVQMMQMPLSGDAAPAVTEPLPTSYPIDVHFAPDGTVSPDSPRVGTGNSKPFGPGK